MRIYEYLFEQTEKLCVSLSHDTLPKRKNKSWAEHYQPSP